jgi:hypothetical protein
MEEVEFEIDILRGQRALLSLNGKHVPIFGQEPNDNINHHSTIGGPFNSCLHV